MKPTFQVVLLLAAALILTPVLADAFDKNDPNVKACASCHTLTKEEAATLIGSDVNSIVGIAPGPLRGLWEVAITSGGKVIPVYVDYSKKYLFQGNVIRFADKENITRGRFEDLNRVDVSSISLKNAIVVGNRSAKKGIIVLTDPTCPFCVKLHDAMKEVITKNPEAAFFVMPYPRDRDNKALYDKILSAICDKSGKILDDLFAGKEVPPATCKSDAVSENIRLAERLQIPGTPTMILPDGRVIGGYRNVEELLKLTKLK